MEMSDQAIISSFIRFSGSPDVCDRYLHENNQCHRNDHERGITVMRNEKEMEKLCELAYELGKKYEQTYKGCGQCFVGAVQDALKLKGDEVFKATTAFAGGIGLMGDGSCGAYVGGVLLLGDRLGREKSDFVDAPGVRFKTYALARNYHDRFIEKYGSVTCRDIHMKIFGRPYFLNDKEEFTRFEKAGGHDDKCPGVVGTAARWLVEILTREELI